MPGSQTYTQTCGTSAAAAAAAKWLQLCPTLCNPIDSSLPGCSVPGIFQARTLEWVHLLKTAKNKLLKKKKTKNKSWKQWEEKKKRPKERYTQRKKIFIADFSSEIKQVRRKCSDTFKILKEREKTNQPRIAYPVKIYFRNKWEINTLSDKQNQKIHCQHTHTCQSCLGKRNMTRNLAPDRNLDSNKEIKNAKNGVQDKSIHFLIFNSFKWQMNEAKTLQSTVLLFL